MKTLKVVAINSESLVFDNGTVLYSDHQQDCCENHYLSFADIKIQDFDGLLFNPL